MLAACQQNQVRSSPCASKFLQWLGRQTHSEGEELAVTAGAQGGVGRGRHRVGEDGVHLGQQAQDGAVVAGGASQLHSHGNLGRCQADREGAGCSQHT